MRGGIRPSYISGRLLVHAVRTPHRFVPCLKYIIQNATTNELRLLRGKTIECISLIGLAVGAEKFLPDASEVMEMLLKTQKGENEEMSDDDPQVRETP